MFGRKRDATTEVREVRERPIAARGGLSLGAVITGALVAIGAFFLLTSIVGAVLSQTGVTAEELAQGDEVETGVAGGIALLVAWFFSFTWGGYTAGRMGRGAGFLNGLLVPFAVILLAAIVGAVAWAFGASEGWTLVSPTEQLRVEGEYTSVDYGIGLAAITLGVMFLGSVVGGLMGSRWHTKLERRAEADRTERIARDRRPATDNIDLRDRQPATTTAGTYAAGQPPPAPAPTTTPTPPPPRSTTR